MWRELIERLQAQRFMMPEGGDGAGAASGGGGSGSSGGGSGAGAGDKGAAGAGAAGAGDGAGAAGAGDAGKGDDGSLFADHAKGADAGDGKAGDAAGKGDDKKGDLTPEQRALQAAEKDTRRPKEVPAKFWDAEKGEVRYAAWAQSTAELEQRMRTVGLPPKSADEYKFEVPKEVKDMGLDLDQASAKEFREQAHALGLTQKQYESVMGAYFKHAGQLSMMSANMGKAKLNQALLEHYKTPEALSENVKKAFSVVSAYGDERDMQEAMGVQGNTPPWVYRVLAKVGAELGEDPGVKPDAVLEGDTLEHLMRGAPGAEDSPYWNSNDPRHKATVAKVTRYHEARAAAARRKAA